MAIGKKTGGRTKGTPNKKTAAFREEQRKRELAAERIAAAAGQPGAGTAIAKALDAQHVWAKDELAEVIPKIRSIVDHFGKVPMDAVAGKGQATKEDWDALRTWLQLFIDTNHKLAPYQSPTFRAVAVVGQDPDKQGVVRFVVEGAPAIDAVAVEGQAA